MFSPSAIVSPSLQPPHRHRRLRRVELRLAYLFFLTTKGPDFPEWVEPALFRQHDRGIVGSSGYSSRKRPGPKCVTEIPGPHELWRLTAASLPLAHQDLFEEHIGIVTPGALGWWGIGPRLILDVHAYLQPASIIPIFVNCGLRETTPLRLPREQRSSRRPDPHTPLTCRHSSAWSRRPPGGA
jgi:hypothetical protein